MPELCDSRGAHAQMAHHVTGLRKLIVVGAGRFGINHILTAHKLGVLQAVVDLNKDALTNAANKLPDNHSVRFYTTLSEAMHIVPDAAVVVATPPSTHFAVARQAIDARRDVLVEKPLCDTLERAQQLVQIADSAGCVLMVDHLLQYSLQHCRLLQLVHSGFVGEVTRVKMTRMNFGTVRTEENVLWSFSPHDVSVLLSICNNHTPVDVVCVGQNVVSCGIEDYIDLSVRFEDGVHAQIEASWMHPLKERRTVVYGTNGCIVLNEASPHPNLPKLQGFKWTAKRKSDGTAVTIQKNEHDLMRMIDESDSATTGSTENTPEKQPLEAAIEHFLHCRETRSRPRTDGKEGCRVLSVLTAATESLAKVGAAVTLPSRQNVKVFSHPSAVIDTGAIIGAGTKVWHFSHIMSGARLGEFCNIGQNVYIGGKAVLGKNVKVQNNVSIYDAVLVGDDVFLGPSCVLTNVKTPRSHVNRKNEFTKTTIGKGATVGANATIVCGVQLSDYCFVGAGAVVTKDVPAHALVFGNPATIRGWVSTTGVKLVQVAEMGEGRKVLQCTESKEVYTLYENGRGDSESPCLISHESNSMSE